jgi:hypothetical protein
MHKIIYVLVSKDSFFGKKGRSDRDLSFWIAIRFFSDRELGVGSRSVKKKIAVRPQDRDPKNKGSRSLFDRDP